MKKYIRHEEVRIAQLQIPVDNPEDRRWERWFKGLSISQRIFVHEESKDCESPGYGPDSPPFSFE